MSNGITSGELHSILEGPPTLRPCEAVMPLDILTFQLLGGALYDTKAERQAWRKEVDFFLECILQKDFRYGMSLKELAASNVDTDFLKRAIEVVQNSRMRDFGLYGQALAKPDRIQALKVLRGDSHVRNEDAPYAGATSLKAMLKPLVKKETERLSPDQLEKAVLYPRNKEAILLGKVLTHLIRMAHAGIPKGLQSFEPERDVMGIIRECFNSVYSRATVKVERSLLECMQQAFRQKMNGMDIIVFLPLYQLVYGRDKTHYQLQPSVGTWLNLFGQQGSETCYYVHLASRYIERPGRGSNRFYPLSAKWPFYLKQIETEGECGKYPGIYLFYGEDGAFPIGENSYFPKNFPAQAFFLGEEIWGLPSWVYPSLSVSKRSHAFNVLVEDNPITKVPRSYKATKHPPEFEALMTALQDNYGEWTEAVTPHLLKVVNTWAKDRGKEKLFEKNLGRLISFAQGGINDGRQYPLSLAAPMRQIPSDGKRTVYDQGSLEQKALDSLTNKYGQSIMSLVNKQMKNLFTNYLPNIMPLDAMHELGKIMMRKERPTLFNVDVAKAFDSIDLNKNPDLWDAWLDRADQCLRKITQSDWHADKLKNIFQPFVERVRGNFYGTNGKTPLGLTLGPLFWLYISLPLAKALVDAKDRGDCLWATMTGDDTLAVLSPKMDAAQRHLLWTVFEDFSKLGFTFHFFKNQNLSFDTETRLEREGAFAENWPSTVPVIHAGLALHKHLVHILPNPHSVNLDHLKRQAKLSVTHFPTNLIRLAQVNGHLSGSPTERTLRHQTPGNSSKDVLPTMASDNAPDVSMIELTRLTTSSHTNASLQFFNQDRLLQKTQPKVKTKNSTQEELDHRRVSAIAYHERLKQGASLGNSQVMFQNLRKKVFEGFPNLPESYANRIQGSLGDTEAVFLQLLIRNETSAQIAKCKHAVKMQIALLQAKVNNITFTHPKTQSLPVPLVKLASENPELMFPQRQKTLAEKGSVLAPRFALYFDHENKLFKLSSQALQVLGRKGGPIQAPSPNVELLSGLCQLTGRDTIKMSARLATDEQVGAEVLRIFDGLTEVQRQFIKAKVKEFIKRCLKRDKQVQEDLNAALGSPEGGWDLVARAWKQSSVVRVILAA